MVQLMRAAPALLTNDVFETAEYYRDVLGFSFEGVFGAPPSFVILDRGWARLMFRQPPKPASLAPNAGAVGEFFDVFLYADDVEALAEEFRAKGADIVMDPVYRPIWNGKEMAVRDPNGWILCFGESLDGESGRAP
jgi:catechol 2,3-dioxygenase-like lactoylglutathione lyase family enzyme